MAGHGMAGHGMTGHGMAAPIRVLVVDDSATMRAMIRHSLRNDPQL